MLASSLNDQKWGGPFKCFNTSTAFIGGLNQTLHWLFFPSFLCFKIVLHDIINTMILWTSLRCLFNFSGLGPLSFSSMKKCLQSSLTISLQATSFRHFLDPLHSWTWCFFNFSSHSPNDKLVVLNLVQSSHLILKPHLNVLTYFWQSKIHFDHSSCCISGIFLWSSYLGKTFEV